jgi:hypothetical protein
MFPFSNALVVSNTSKKSPAFWHPHFCERDLRRFCHIPCTVKEAVVDLGAKLEKIF